MRTFIVGGLILVFFAVQLMRGGSALRTIDGDGSGYYSYLTAVFVHGTTDFTPVFETEKSRRSLDYMGHYFHPFDGKLINKYYLGTALLMLPFFLLAWLYSLITGMPPDGYNILFQYAISLGAAVYAAIGLLAAKRFLMLSGLARNISLFTILLLIFGTNLFFYTFLHPSHSHVYSFAAIAGFLLTTKRFMLWGRRRDFYFSMALLGLVVLIRPSNAIIVLIWPFLAGSVKQLKEQFLAVFHQKKMLLVGTLLFVGVFSIQMIYNYIQTGHLVLWSYRNEGFHFSQPALLSFLFSFRKGFFIYTPLMLLMIPGLMLFYHKSIFQFFTFTGFLFVLLYFLSSWWNWFFGDSFGMRAMIDFYSLLALPLGMFIAQIYSRTAGKIAFGMLVVPLLALNLLQTYQYYSGIIHPDSMTKAKYWHVFMKTGKEYRNIFGSFPEPVYKSLEDASSLCYFNDMEGPSLLWTSNGIQLSEDAYSGRYLAEMSQSNIYSPTLVLGRDQLGLTNNELYISVNLMYRELEKNAATEALLVYAASNTNGELSFYKTFRLKQMPDKQSHIWRNATFGFKVPAWTEQTAEVKLYVWNTPITHFQLDDFEINIHQLD